MTAREVNCRVFFDTETWCRSTEKLRRWIRKSVQGTRLYDENEPISLPGDKPFEKTGFAVTRERTFACAERLMKEHEGKRVGVLNFASATHPGGGVRSGASAQEEALCRCSTLYPVLTSPSLKPGYYDYHRKQGGRRYTGRCIYTPDIVICKTDQQIPQRMAEEEWRRADVISCAAPNLRTWNDDASGADRIPQEELLAIHQDRARRILSVAASNGIELFVSGAHGCGAFRNDPKVVAAAWKNVLPEFDGYFLQIVFAVYSAKDDENYETFSRIINHEKVDS